MCWEESLTVQSCPLGKSERLSQMKLSYNLMSDYLHTRIMSPVIVLWVFARIQTRAPSDL